MNCALCHTHIDLWDLDEQGYEGLPAHRACAAGYRTAAREFLAELETMIRAEPNKRRHRQSARR